MSRPDYLKSGERARLLPVVSESNKENRLIGPVLGALPILPELAKALLGELGQRVGTRAKLSCYTEVVFNNQEDTSNRPDGLIVLSTGRSEWRCLVEAKFGKSKLVDEQVDRYLELAIKNNIDAVLTISNQFVATPKHSPVSAQPKLLKKCELFHLSWSMVASFVDLLLSNGQVHDPDRELVLHELHEYLRHPASQIEGFTQMNKEWKDVVKRFMSGAKVPKNDQDMLDVVSCWHQEQKDLCVILSNMVKRPVGLKLTRAELESADEWTNSTRDELLKSSKLTATIEVPDVAGNVHVEADLRGRSTCFSLKLRAPSDRKTTQARANWLLKQLKDVVDPRIDVRIHYPGRKDYEDYDLQALLEDSSTLAGRNEVAANYLEVRLVNDQPGRFSGSRTFIEDTEEGLKVFYKQVVASVKAWQPSAPKPVEPKESEEFGEA